jgi:Protein of unknown function (DUF2971)
MSEDAQSAQRAWADEVFAPIQRDWYAAWGSRHEKVPRELYHYTAAAGVAGIVTSQCLWASNARFLNDTTELVYAREVLRKVMADLAEAYPAESLAVFFERGGQLLDDVDVMFDAYVACFCEQADLLSQWRGYPGAGGGYAIGFDTRFWRRSLEEAFLRRVIYPPEEQEAIIRELIQPLADALRRLASAEGEAAAENAVPECLRRARPLLTECSFCFKHPTFMGEAEWRLVWLGAQWGQDVGERPIKFRPATTSLVPYVELAPLARAGHLGGRLPICRVVVGPTAHPELASQAARVLLNQNGYPWVHTPVQASTVPLRA